VTWISPHDTSRLDRCVPPVPVSATSKPFIALSSCLAPASGRSERWTSLAH
jgi:hypothetical protein